MAELATERMVVGRPAGAVLRRGERHRALPGVGGDIKHVVVRAATTRAGRPRSPSGPAPSAGAPATPCPTTTPAPRALAWKQTPGDLTSKLDGGYRFETAEDGGDRGDLHARGGAAGPLPGFIKRRAQSRIMHTALEELKARVESSLTT